MIHEGAPVEAAVERNRLPWTLRHARLAPVVRISGRWAGGPVGAHGAIPADGAGIGIGGEDWIVASEEKRCYDHARERGEPCAGGLGRGGHVAVDHGASSFVSSNS